MSVFEQHAQAVRDAAAAAVKEATAALEDRITALEAQVLELLQPTAEPAKASTRKARGTVAGAGTASASGTSN